MKDIVNGANYILNISVILFFLTIAVSPQALADDAAAQRIKELENQLQTMHSNMQMMQNGMQAMQSELEKLKSESSQVTQKVEHIQQKAQEVEKEQKTRPVAVAHVKERNKNNMVFFRGGFAHNTQHHNGLTFQSNVVPAGVQDRPDKNAWYFGAGFDWNLTDDAWGMAPKTSVLAELMFEYKEFSSKVQGNALANVPTPLIGGAENPRNVTVSQLSIYASPKIKFREGSRFRPWIIPAGFGVHIISPPGESGSFFIPGVVFGGGAEYRIWKDFYAGVDARYNLTGGKKDGVVVDGLTAGGYVGIGF
ncbi:MAG: porin family protein [Betaproteobacteria bacterium]|nr:porin family protein [Betaproteobacteria bacterium]